jgi:hypothetical protein
MANIPIINFSSGEFSPQIDCRSDIEKYVSGCRYLENFLPLIYGCVERRPGTVFIASTINLSLILASIVAWENVASCYENVVVSTLANTATNNALMPVFVCYQNDILCYENETVIESQTAVLSEEIYCYENNVLFYQNDILRI